MPTPPHQRDDLDHLEDDQPVDDEQINDEPDDDEPAEEETVDDELEDDEPHDDEDDELGNSHHTSAAAVTEVIVDSPGLKDEEESGGADNAARNSEGQPKRAYEAVPPTEPQHRRR